jgi:hypothetical protein
MKDILAERLLAEVMRWEPADVAQERPVLQALAAVKYDEYQQFSPGMKFVENLARWLDQFKSTEHRQRAYDFVRRRLVFISQEEMAHLVGEAFPDFIRPILMRQVAKDLAVPLRCVKTLVSSAEYKVRLRQSLFLGLSDGAQIGLFRRINRDISNEQVWQTHEIAPTRAKGMLKELRSDLVRLRSGGVTEAEAKFRTIFLLDDFAGSGFTSLRKGDKQGEFDGRIYQAIRGVIQEHEHGRLGSLRRIYQAIRGMSQERGLLRSLVAPSDVSVCVLFYLATAKALLHIRQLMNGCASVGPVGLTMTADAVQTLPDEVRLSDPGDTGMLDLLKQHFDDSIMDEHFRKGKHERPYLGFDECGLPLVLSHNTPNNSIPLLWYEEGGHFKGLFPRVSRHRGDV